MRLAPTIIMLAQLGVSVSNEFKHNLIEELTSTHQKNQPQLILLGHPNNHIDLTPNKAIKITEIPMGIASGNAYYQSGGLFVDLPPIAPNRNKVIIKTIPNLWRVILPKNWSHVDIPVTTNWYDNDPTSMLASMSIKPWIQRRQQQKDGSEIIEGGIILHINSDSLKAVNFSSQINIELKPF